jgi:hypothetical protein
VAQKDETTFSRNFNTHLSTPIYCEKTSNPWRKGTPDFYLEYNGKVLWREDKFNKKPLDVFVPAEELCKTSSWPHQLRWLRRAHSNGILARVLVGAPRLAVLIEPPFDFDPSRHFYLPRPIVAKNLETLLQ